MYNLMYKAILYSIVWVVLCLPVNHSIAGELDGESLFQSKCGLCHGDGMKAPKIAPVKYAAIQWERFFDREKHQRKQDIISLINKEERSRIKKYLMEHAADSDLPIAAGMK